MLKNTLNPFFDTYDKAELTEIKYGRVALLEFTQNNKQYQVTFDLKRRTVIGVKQKDSSRSALFDDQREELKQAVIYEMEAQEDYLSGLSFCGECTSYYFNEPCLC